MNLNDLYTRVVETTGLMVVTPESLCVAVRNCYADLTSRNYRNFKEEQYNIRDFTVNADGMTCFPQPKDYRRVVYAKVLCENEMRLAARANLANPALLSRYNPKTQELRTNFTNMKSDTIYYIKDRIVHVETANPNIVPRAVLLGYYAKLLPPPIVETAEDLAEVHLDLREEFEDAVVLYTCYFYYSRFIKDPERIDFYLKQYKYYVEDISHQLASEDMFNEDDAVIPYED